MTEETEFEPVVVGIDGDPIVYAVGFAAEQTRYVTADNKMFEEESDADRYTSRNYDYLLDTYYDGDDDWDLFSEIYTVKVPEPLEFVLSSVKRMIAGIVEECGADEYIVYLTGSGNFREDIATLQPYKGNRSGHKPAYYNEIREYILTHQNGVLVEGEEADDVLSIRGYQDGHIIATIDKDLMNTPARHYNWQKPELGVFEVTEEEATLNFYHQMLTGDPTDNIPGLFRVTGIRASAGMKRRVSEASDKYAEVLAIYEEAYKQKLPELPKTMSECLLEIGRLLWMRREVGEMWEPGL